MSEVTPYNPYTAKQLYDFMIGVKRQLVAEGLQWTAESPKDLGIAMLKVVSELGGLLSKQDDNKKTQNFLIYAKADEAVHATTRQIGYKIKGSIASKLKVLITANGTQTLPAGTKIEKVLVDGTKIKFELLDETIFTSAGSKWAYILQGETFLTTFTGDNTAFQSFIIPNYPIAYGGIVFAVGSDIWTEVEDFVDSGADSKHYVVEYDYMRQPTILTGDGVFGAKPASSAVVSIAYRTCDGSLGNIGVGEMEFVNRFAHITSITNEPPSTAILSSNISITDVEIEVIDDGSISSFRDTGVAYIDDDSFTYTNIVGNKFIGVTGLEDPHSEGETVSYSTSFTYGQDKETNKEAKINAIRNLRLQKGANSVLDYDYLTSKVGGVARTKSLVSYNNITIQIVPADGGVPSSTLKSSVLEYMANKKNANHTLSLLDPGYVYVDVNVEVAPGAGYNFTNDVKPIVIETIQNYLNPLKKDDSSMYYLNGWGNLLKKNLLEADIFELYNRSLVSDVEITSFKRSSDVSGDSNIQLAENEIAQIGKINVIRKGISYEIPAGEMGGASGTVSIPKMNRVIL